MELIVFLVFIILLMILFDRIMGAWDSKGDQRMNTFVKGHDQWSYENGVYYYKNRDFVELSDDESQEDDCSGARALWDPSCPLYHLLRSDSINSHDLTYSLHHDDSLASSSLDDSSSSSDDPWTLSSSESSSTSDDDYSSSWDDYCSSSSWDDSSSASSWDDSWSSTSWSDSWSSGSWNDD